jgi:hypothetical protein
MRSLILIAAVSLAACQPTLPPVNSTTPAVAIGDKVLVQGANALADAADAYSVVAATATAVIKAGVPKLTDDQVRMIRVLNNQAIGYINGADATLSVAERAANLTLVVSQLRSIVGSK